MSVAPKESHIQKKPKSIPRNVGIFMNDPSIITLIKPVIRKLIGAEGVILQKEDLDKIKNGLVKKAWYSHAIFDSSLFLERKKYLKHFEIVVACCDRTTLLDNIEIEIDSKPASIILLSDNLDSIEEKFRHYLGREPLFNKWGFSV